MDSEFTILVVDDDEAVRDSLSGYLEAEGWTVKQAASGPEALEVVRTAAIDAVISDIRMPGMDGITLLKKLKELHSDVEVLITTGHSSEDTAISALKAGAFDYFRKPLEGQKISASLRRTKRLCELKQENHRLSALVERLNKGTDRCAFVGDSPAAKRLLGMIEKVSASPHSTVLVTGESGTGKEIAARLIHYLTNGGEGPFMALNCGGVAETLLESELFGHERGAFTGADKRSPGIFEMAIGGTVFLDEIGELSMAAQTRLLRVLEERTVRRLGGQREVSVANTRVISATNRNLADCVEQGTFREDLYYRIQVAPILVPPLRERRQDIIPLALHFLQQLGQRIGRTWSLSESAHQALIQAEFKGNIRDLRNMIERGVIFADNDVIEPRDLGLMIQGETRLPDTGSYNLRDHEVMLLQAALKEHPGNHSAASRALGISPQALYRKIEKFGLTM
ncbi:MAG TPA: hypothetical protein DCR55_13535 [Lentisphaeria bacterium]|nr:hypothetical protein [Lentisphaeria bacterium]